MNAEEKTEITEILHQWNEGVEGSEEKLLPIVYEELKKQARIFMSRERSNHTLQPTALVNEAFIRISDQTGVEWVDRKHFYGIASRLMRQILVDHARKKNSQKRGNNVVHFSLEDYDVPVEDLAYSLIALNDSLEKLAELDERQSKIVEMRFFGGLTQKEIAEHFEISERTVMRDWRSAKLWLLRDINGE